MTLDATTPSELPPPPRTLRRRPQHGSLIGGAHVLVALMTLSAVAVFLFAGQATSVSMVGVRVPGQVVKQSTEAGSDGKSTDYDVTYRYTVDGTAITHDTYVSESMYKALAPGTPITVQALPSMPGLNELIVAPVKMSTSFLGSMWFFEVIWTAGICFAWWRILFLPLRIRKIIETGTACPGTIVDKRVSHGRTTYYSISYRFQPETAAIVAWQRVWSVDFNAVNVGQAVNVIYDPKRPSRSVVYDCADYEVSST